MFEFIKDIFSKEKRTAKDYKELKINDMTLKELQETLLVYKDEVENLLILKILHYCFNYKFISKKMMSEILKFIKN